MKTIHLLFSLIFLFGLASCSNPSNKTLSDYEQTLCRTDSLVRSGTVDSAQVVLLLSDLHREYDELKELSGTKLVRMTPLPWKERALLISVCIALLVLAVWLSMLEKKISTDNKRRHYTAVLSENEENIQKNQREMNELEDYIKKTPQTDETKEETEEAYVHLMDRDDALRDENRTLRTRLKEYEKRPLPRDLELLEKQSERLRLLDEQMRTLTSTLIDHDGLVEQLRAQPRYLTDADWDYLKQLVDRMYAGFTQRLSARFSPLTNAELQLCLLIRLRFTNAQIATLTAVSPSTVSQQKFRLKKRLLQADETLFKNGETLETLIWGC